METFTMQFANVKTSSCDIGIMWDKYSCPLPISTDVETKVMAQIEPVMNKDNRPYYNAAMYYMDNGKDLNQALAWFDKAVEANPNAQPWVHTPEGKLSGKTGQERRSQGCRRKINRVANETKMRIM